ncbi:MAG: SDR family NAD(P)-dependent oxidoreductase [Acidobacteriota bacterium]|nr:SDR family NAD(P)-dependent oxidoreductase [Acidobacteriota bacterium]
MTPRLPGIAIVGIGCRFPGGASTPDRFWKLLREGVDAISDVPLERYDVARYFDADAAKAGALYTRRGGFIENIQGFDARFFGISPREAVRIDPQHRLLLEVAWEALEDAGEIPERLAGSNTGVFVGISTHDYGDIQMYPGNRHLIDGYANSGTATSIAANRVSYLFDFRGPSLAVDTACSSSLTAVHLACQALGNGDCDVALAGGVQVLLTPELTIGFCKATMLSPDGRCKAFDARANGYVRGEGAGVVVLKPLAAAVAAGDSIYAVIRATAINEDGRTSGMTVPSRAAQEEMLRDACRKAGVSPADIHYVEAHGTGTPVGDPIEASAIGTVLSEGRPKENRLSIGSVKTNIGHLEAASGIAGLAKVALALRHRELPPSLHLETLNPAIAWDQLGLRVQTRLEPLPDGPRPVVAGVNSFGFGGANAHIILEEPPRPGAASASVPNAERACLLTISAKSPEALRAHARAYRDLLVATPQEDLEEICRTAALRRSHHDEKLAVVGKKPEDIADHLDAFLRSETRADVAFGRTAPGHRPKLAFVFAGMGPQWWGMGRRLLSEEPVFRSVLEACDRENRRHASWSLLDELHADESRSRVGEADFAQSVNFAFQAALCTLLREWGIEADAVVGHSAGEIAALWAAGSLSLADGVRVAFHRGRLQHRASGKGRMLAAALSHEQARDLIAPYGHRAAVAAVNSPSSVTLSGETAALEEIAAALQEQKVFARLLPVMVPYHSAAMDPIETDLLAALADVTLKPSTIPIVSEVTGRYMDGMGFDAAYWWRNIRQPVLFADAIDQLVEDGFDLFLEVSAHPALTGSIAECLAKRGVAGAAVPTLRRMEDDRSMLLRAAGALETKGRAPDRARVHGDGPNRARLPLYPWQRERLWFESAPADDAEGTDPAAPADAHPLLGRRLRSARPSWEVRLSRDRLGYLHDHRIQGAVVFPGAGFVEMALAAAREIDPDGTPFAENVEFHKALFLPEEGKPALQISVDPAASTFEVHGLPPKGEAGWPLHSSGRIGRRKERAPARTEDLDALRARLPGEVSGTDCYESFALRGLAYGPAFRGITRLRLGPGEALGEIDVPEGVSLGGYEAHPALLDAAFQVLIAATPAGTAAEHAPLFLPIRIASVETRGALGPHLLSHARLVAMDGGTVEGDVRILDPSGAVLLDVKGLRCQVLEDHRGAAEAVDDWLYDFRWEAANRRAVSPAEVARLVEATATPLALERGWPRYYGEIEPLLETLTLGYFAAALKSVDRSAVAPRHERLHKRMVASLEEDGTPPPAAFDPRALADAILAIDPAYASALALITRCGESLGAVLTGATDARELLFADASFTAMKTFYREAPPSRTYNALVAGAVTEAARSLGGGRTVRILELGAGTGGTTAAVLSGLSAERTTYVMTDVSPSFLALAREEFAEFPFVTYKPLDLEEDPGEQGFEEESFDVILAANVLHATADLRGTLERVKTLLAPGGLLVLLEITRHPRWLDLVFGLTAGWWTFTDAALRTDSPLLEAPAWRALLGETGFEEASVLTDAPARGGQAQSVFLARVPSRARAEDGGVLILPDRRGAGLRLAGILSAHGRLVEIAESHESVANVLGRLKAAGARIAHVVHLRSLDAPSPEHADAVALLDAQALVTDSALDLVQALENDGSAERPKLWLVTAGAQAVDDVDGIDDAGSLAQSPLWGLGRVILNENADLHPTLVDLGSGASREDVESLAAELLDGESEEEVAIRGRSRFVRRLRRLPTERLDAPRALRPEPGSAYRATIETPGALGTLALHAARRRSPGPGQIEIEVEAAALNFRDVMLAMGMLPAEARSGTFGKDTLGFDCAGTVVACGEGVMNLQPGDAIVGIAPAAFASHAITRADLAVRRPAALGALEAATLPCAFITALYGLEHLARIQEGERVLIHAATGGVGLAAIQIARLAGAEIFATAGSPEKRAHLAALGIPHVMDSRSLAFADEVLEATGGKGVDVILNSLSGEAIPRGISILSPYGRFLEIGKRDIYQDKTIGLHAFRRNLSFFAIDVDRLCAERPELVGAMLQETVSRIASGAWQPLPRHEFPIDKIEDAFRFMAQARHMGKVVVRMDPPATVAPAIEDDAIFRKDATYLVSGGLGGFGAAVSEWMVRAGARNLVLMSRNVSPSPEAAAAIARMEQEGARVVLAKGDVSREADVEGALGGIRSAMPPLRGVIHAAMVLDDGALMQQTPERFRAVLAPKMAGAWNLHKLTARDPIEHFVLFSSIASLFGNPLQGNYAAANAFLDALAGYRRARGLPALAVNWGVVSEVGYVSRHPEIAEYLHRQGYRSFTAAQALHTLGRLVRSDLTQVIAARIDWAQWVKSAPAAASSPRLLDFIPRLESDGGPANRAARGDALETLLAAAPPERAKLLEAFLVAQVARVIGTSPQRIETGQPLTEMGFDSLMAVEFVTLLHMELGVEVPVVKLLQGISVRQLALHVLELLALNPPAAAPAAPAPLMAKTSAEPPAAPMAIPVATPPSPTPPAASRIAADPSRAERLRDPEANRYSRLDYARWSPAQEAARRTMTAGLRSISRIDVEGAENIPASGPVLLAVNHLSMWDVPFMLSVLDRPTIVLATDDLKRYPWLDLFLGKLGNAIYVRRGEGDMDALAQGLAVLRAGGALALSPEGSRSSVGTLGEGRTGIAHLALKSGASIVPAVAWGQERMAASWKRLGRAPVSVRIGKPFRLDAAGLNGDSLREHTAVVMSALAALLPPEYRGRHAVGTAL